MTTITYQELKKLCRPYTPRQMRKKSGSAFGIMTDPQGSYATNEFILIANPKRKILEEAVEHPSVTEERVTSLVGDYSTKIPATPTQLFHSVKLHDVTEVEAVKFTTEEGRKIYVDARYLRLLWDKDCNAQFMLHEQKNMLCAYSLEGNFLGAVMGIHICGGLQ